MGLDMYLTTKRYIGEHITDLPKNGNEILKLIDDEITFRDKTIGVYIEVNLAYWRKANQIHGWFMDNTKVTEEDVYSEVSREDLVKLKNVCKEVLEDNDKAEDLLPCQEGFFFGNYEYDEKYFYQLKDTIQFIENILKTDIEVFEYYASW